MSFRLPDFKTILHTKAIRLLNLRTGRLYPKEIFLVLIFVKGWVDSLLLGYVQTTSYLEHQTRNGVKRHIYVCLSLCLECFWEWGKTGWFGRPSVSSTGPIGPVQYDTWGRTTGGTMKKAVGSQCHVLYTQRLTSDSTRRLRSEEPLSYWPWPLPAVNLSTYSDSPCTWSLLGLPPVCAMNSSNSCRVSFGGCLCLMSKNALDSLNTLAICTVWRRSP